MIVSEIPGLFDLPVDRASWIAILAGTVGALLALVCLGRMVQSRQSSKSTKPTDRDESAPIPLDTPSERRRALRRKGSTVEVDVHPLDQPTSNMIARVLDRSLGGLRLEMGRSLAIGTVLRARPRNAPKETPSVDLEVRFCTKSGSEFHIGCSYVRVPVWSVQMLFE